VSRRTLFWLAALAATALLAAGCGAVARVTSGNPGEGKTLFVAKCGACHTLAKANTQGTIGPNLDDAFAASKAQGFGVSTVVDVVRGQIAYPDSRPGTVCKKSIGTSVGKGLSCTSTQGMPSNLVHGQEARDIAVFVGLCSQVLDEKTGGLSPDPTCTTKNASVQVPG
jgi:Cytochrome c